MPLLHVVVPDQVEAGPLREHCCVVIDGTVAEMVGQPRVHLIPANQLQKLAIAEDSAGFCTEDEKSLTGALDAPDRDRLGLLSD